MHGPSSKADHKLATTFACLESGGMVIVQDFLLNAGKTGPLRPALFNLMIGAFSVAEMMGLIGEAGFADITHYPLEEELGTGLITAVKPD